MSTPQQITSANAARGLALLYGVVCYAVFFLTFPAAAFLAIFDGAEPWMWADVDELSIDFHAFRCRSCDRVRGHVDMS